MEVTEIWKKAEGNDVHDVTGIPEGVVEGRELRAVDGVRDLRNQHGRGVGYFCGGTRE